MVHIAHVEGTSMNPLTPKKLPCAHIFHFRCLKTWLERQQSCPTWYSINIIDNSK